MKLMFLAIMLFAAPNLLLGQTPGVAKNSLAFDRPYTHCERKWVVFPKKDTAQSYLYGFVYLDAHAGFTFISKGYLKINSAGRYLSDTSMFANAYPRTRLPRHTGNLALLPPEHFVEMGLDPLPIGLATYYTYADTLEHDYHWGFVYNDLGQCDTALIYLNRAYLIKPHYKNLEFELIYAHTALKDYDSVIKISLGAIDNDPLNVIFYRELGYAYMQQKKYFNAISTFKAGINLCTDDSQNNTKAEMAINLASVYRAVGSETLYKNWGRQAKIWAAPGTEVYEFIVSRGF